MCGNTLNMLSDFIYIYCIVLLKCFCLILLCRSYCNLYGAKKLKDLATKICTKINLNFIQINFYHRLDKSRYWSKKKEAF